MNFWDTGLGMIVWISIAMVLAIALVVGLVVGIAFFVLEPICDGSAQDTGFNYRWLFWGGCQIEVEPDMWIPMSNYFYEHE